MNVEVERDGVKVSVDAPDVRTKEEREHVVELVLKALVKLDEGRHPRPLPFGFSVWTDTERKAEEVSWGADLGSEAGRRT